MDESHSSQPPYNHWFPLVRFYWYRVQSVVAGLVDCSHDGVILDFGCGKEKILKKNLSGHTVIGYDVIKEFRDIDDYRKIRPQVIVCSHVLEHLGPAELERTLEDFIAMGPRYIITAQPTENNISRLSWFFSGKKELTKKLTLLEHKLTIDKIHSVLAKYFILQERKNVLTLTVVSKWVLRIRA
ncbi:MAG: methyltransferase domain-containing protein [Candidatus Omnitrophota bacterium]|nr:hypothetical protein [Candidatus Omnitrophota bacterium]